MMLTFSVVPQTLLVKGFQPTVNATEKPSPQSPTQTIHPLTADSFTPSAVKSRAGGSATEALEAFKQVLTRSNLEQDVEGGCQTALGQIAVYIETLQGQDIVSDAISHLKTIPNQSTKLKQALETLRIALEDLLPKSEADRGQATASFNLEQSFSGNSGDSLSLYKSILARQSSSNKKK